MFDVYEKKKWAQIKEVRAKICDLQAKVDDFLTESELDSDQWFDVYHRVNEMTGLVGLLEKIILVVRCRRLEIDDKAAKKANQK